MAFNTGAFSFRSVALGIIIHFFGQVNLASLLSVLSSVHSCIAPNILVVPFCLSMTKYTVRAGEMEVPCRPQFFGSDPCVLCIFVNSIFVYVALWVGTITKFKFCLAFFLRWVVLRRFKRRYHARLALPLLGFGIQISLG